MKGGRKQRTLLSIGGWETEIVTAGAEEEDAAGTDPEETEATEAAGAAAEEAELESGAPDAGGRGPLFSSASICNGELKMRLKNPFSLNERCFEKCERQLKQ